MGEQWNTEACGEALYFLLNPPSQALLPYIPSTAITDPVTNID